MWKHSIVHEDSGRKDLGNWWAVSLEYKSEGVMDGHNAVTMVRMKIDECHWKWCEFDEDWSDELMKWIGELMTEIGW